MTLLSEITIGARARFAETIARVIDADGRVRRWRKIEFAEDGGAQVVVELRAGSSGIAREVIARELEFAVTTALPQLPWVRVQLA